jgi:hypothetical protein
MLEMIAAEFAATGAELISWFHGLFAGNKCWPSN